MAVIEDPGDNAEPVDHQLKKDTFGLTRPPPNQTILIGRRSLVVRCHEPYMAQLGHVAILLILVRPWKKGGWASIRPFIVGRSTCLDFTQTSDAIG